MNLHAQKSKQSFALIVFFALILLLSGAMIAVFASYSINNSASAKNVNVLAASMEEPPQDFKMLPASNIDHRAELDFVYNGKHYKYVDELIEPTDHLVAEDIYNRKINAQLADKLRMVERCLNAGSSYENAILYCFPLLEKTVDKIKGVVDTKPIDSTITFSPDKTPMFAITKEKVGYELVNERLYQSIYLSLRTGVKSTINVLPKIIDPKITFYDNAKATHLRARFTTDYAQSSENRRHNIVLSLKRINGTVLAAGEEFSFNKIVGQRTQKNGYKEGKIILNGEYVDGIGGGVCQSSTTVYNCALRADLKITSVRNHSFVSSYVEPSFDAMVNSGSSDLRFRNDSKQSVFIRAYGTQSMAVVEIYGTKLPYKIVTQSLVTQKNEPPPDIEVLDSEGKYIKEPTASGEKIRVSFGHGKLKSEGYLLYYSFSGKLIKKQLIRKDTYSESSGIIAIAP